MEKGIDLKGVINRLKRELNFRYDTELSEKLGKDKKYISVIKGRGTFGGEIWIRIFNIAKEEGIDLNWLIHGTLSNGISPEDKIQSMIKDYVGDEGERNELVRRLSGAIVSYQSLPEANRKDEALQLAVRLINLLMSDD